MRILSQGWYPQYEHPDADSLDWHALVAWLVKNTGLPEPEIVEPLMPGTNVKDASQLVFKLTAATDPLDNDLERVDCVMVWLMPELALNNMLKLLGRPKSDARFVRPSTITGVSADIKHPSGPPPKTQLLGNPIGAPEGPLYPGCYRAIDGDNRPVSAGEASKWEAPDGTVYFKSSSINLGVYWYRLG